MRVLHITNNFPTKKFPIFGVFVKEQIASLTRKGISNEVLFINGREKGKLEYIKSIFFIRRKLRKKNFDVIHCHHALSAICLILTGMAKKNKVVVSFQNDPEYELGKRLYNYIKRKTSAQIFKNNSLLINDDKSFYLPNGVDLNFFKLIDKNEARGKLDLKKEKTYILFVSSNFIRPQKRYDRFQKVLQLLKTNYGHDNLEELKLINIERAKIPLYFNAVDLHLLTSDFEGSPNSVKECLTCNTSVVSTNVGNVKDLLKDVNGSFVSEKNNPEELAFLVDKSLKWKGEKKSREKIIQKKLDINSVAEKLINIYRT